MAAVPKTRERIIQASLELFNSQGERSVTTNHIAEFMGISPGNLYYHFRNKQAIIAELFIRYETDVDSFLRLPEGREPSLEDKNFYLESLLEAMWRYRFLHRDLEHLLDSDPLLAERYRLFSQRCLQGALAIYQGFCDAGILLMTAEQVEALTLNSWIILTSWVRFLCTLQGTSGDLSEEMLRRGIYQVMALEIGFIAPQVRAEVEALHQRYCVPLQAFV
ncbi:TetR/AcrR family transcriptional regulator [Pseudomonas segetis]|uniref:Transcriptional regulator, TetR family n=1 Tax=Pseudomonas segetis TaxID=298908 RepID=A0A239G8Y7_9PSED|nr:TetR/AcrR family transcriptional regulator [Pseudomonas segetis]SNS64913.1 transcriptional regulator, TetR family [Pseudomonas segetis]